MERKLFLRSVTLMAFSMSTLGKALRAKDGNFKGDCETTNDILGPFYRENSPERSDLTFEDLVGSEIQLKGVVYKADCTTPIKDVQIEIWHCNTQGEYDNDSDKYNHRGMQKTDEKGEYSFKTIMPGKYLNGKLYRPAHIHFRVTHKEHNELISQLYFKNDPHIDLDPWASQKQSKDRILPIFPDGTNGDITVVFNIYLTNK
jgi:catechol 1,2-dioxygenase